MATKIKRCLYVGLGGTGMSALLHTKKMFVETYGAVPPMIGFLGIDTDGGAYRKELMSKYGTVSLSPNEQMHIRVPDARAAFVTSRQHFGWVPEENVFALTSMTRGAGQIRTNGRFALTCNFDALSNKVRDAVNRICSAGNISNPDYDTNLGADVEVHMVFSISGGTGAGTFINMAYLVKSAINKCKLTGYAVLPDVFESMSDYGMERVKPNAFGSIYDLDWFMHLNGTEKLDFDYVSTRQAIKGAPFNAIFFIDNKNENGDTYNNVEQLSEMISLALVTSAGELSEAALSVTDNLEKSIMNGEGMVANKRAWVSGMGACEILFRGRDMSELCALKYAQRVIQRMMNSCLDAGSVADTWIDSPEVNIRENGGSQNDNVIDFILSRQPRFPLTTISDSQNGRSEADAYIASVAMPKEGEVQAKIRELQSRVTSELHNLIMKSMNQECGVGLARDVLASIQSQNDIFLGEMNSEKSDLTAKQPALDNAVTVASEDLKEYASRFLKTKKGVEEREQTLCGAAYALAVNKREIIRRDAAITFFTSLNVELSEMRKKVSDISSKLSAVNSVYVDRISALANNVSRQDDLTFQINLAKHTINAIGINEDEIQIGDFLRSLPYPGKIFDIDSHTTAEVEAEILSYTSKLPTARKWESTSIEDVMNAMDSENPEKLDNVLRVALEKAKPLLSINTRGQVGYRYGQFCYVGVPVGSKLLQSNERLTNIAGGRKLQFSALGMRDRIIIFNQVGVVPAYFISNLQDYEQKYERCSIFSHIDATLFRRMKTENFSLQPALDDGSEDVGIWVRGFITGLIKNEGGHYYLKDTVHGKALNKFWVEIGTYRDQAFDAFKTDIYRLKQQFEAHFKQFENDKGMSAMQTLVGDVKENYLEKYSQANMDLNEIQQRGNEQIADLLENELQYISQL